MAEKLTVPAITGPTGSGKIELVLSLAEGIPLEVVVCDSRKLFRGLDIGAAKPDPEMRQRVRFHLLDMVEPEQAFTVYDFVPLAIRAVHDILQRGVLPVVEGGTGLYLSALARGFRFERAPAIPDLREMLADRWAKEGYDAFAATALAVFPEARKVLDFRNPRRMLRFLEDQLASLPVDELPEVLNALDMPEAEPAVRQVVREWSRRRGETAIDPDFDIAGFVLEVERDVLWERINRRTREMFARGLVAEVEELLNTGVPADSQALQGIGYQEVVEFLVGRLTLQETESSVAIRTRQLAKRQVTWLRHQLPDATRTPFTTPEERQGTRSALSGQLAEMHEGNLELLRRQP